MTQIGYYRHFKGGTYLVVGVALHSETKEPLVIYKGVGGQMWVRPAAMFTETVEHQGKTVPRFTFLGTAPTH